MRLYAEAYRNILGTVSLSSLTAIVKPYVLFERSMWMNGSLSISGAARTMATEVEPTM